MKLVKSRTWWKFYEAARKHGASVDEARGVADDIQHELRFKGWLPMMRDATEEKEKEL